MAETAGDSLPDMWQTMEYISRIDNHLPVTTPHVRKLFDFISPDYLVHEFMPEDMADWEEKLKIQQSSYNPSNRLPFRGAVSEAD